MGWIRFLAIGALALATAATTGCRNRWEPEFDLFPGPVSARELNSIVLECSNEPDAANRVDQVHDAYLARFAELRRSTLAPLARRNNSATDRDWRATPASLDRMADSHHAAMRAIAALDGILFDELAAALPHCRGAIERCLGRRAVERARAPLANHPHEAPLDLELAFLAIGPTAEEQQRLEPFLVEYRRRLATVTTRVADARLAIPRERMLALEAEAAREESPPDQRASDARLERASLSLLARARDEAEELNEGGLRTLTAAMDPALADEFEQLVQLRSARGGDYAGRFGAEVALAMPVIQGTPAEAALRRYIAIDAELARATLRIARANRQSRLNGRAETARVEAALQQRALQAVATAAAAVAQVSGQPDLPERLAHLGAPSLNALEQRLQELVGSAVEAQRLARRAPATATRQPSKDSPLATESNDEPADPSFARGFLFIDPLRLSRVGDLLALWPTDAALSPAIDQLMDQARVRRSAAWQAQEAELKRLEQRQHDLAVANPAEWNSNAASYTTRVREILATVAAIDTELATEIAAVHGAAADDPRTAATRVWLAAERSAVDWRRGIPPRLQGPCWQVRFNPLEAALAASPTPESRATALQLVADSADEWCETLDAAPGAWLDGVRALIRQALLFQQHPDAPTLEESRGMQSVGAQISSEGAPRRQRQLALLEELGIALGPDAGARATEVAAMQSLPEFFASGPDVRAIIERVMADRELDQSTIQALAAVREDWMRQSRETAAGLITFLFSAPWDELPTSAEDLPVRRRVSAELARLGTERETAAGRALRDAYLLLPEALRARHRNLSVWVVPEQTRPLSRHDGTP